MSFPKVLVLDGPLRGQLIECSGPSFTHPHAVPPGPPTPGQIYRQAAYKVVELVAFSGTLRVATAYGQLDERDLLDLVFTVAAKQATSGVKRVQS